MGVEALKLIKNDPRAVKGLAEPWQAALDGVEPDPVVGIRHATLPDGGCEDFRYHIAAIPQRVGCHFHSEGDELYIVVSGQGRLHWGEVRTADIVGHNVAWEKPVDVEAGHVFNVPPGYAHQLERIGDEELTILFGCPDSHLSDDQDRTMLPDAPDLAGP